MVAGKVRTHGGTLWITGGPKGHIQTKETLAANSFPTQHNTLWA